MIKVTNVRENVENLILGQDMFNHTIILSKNMKKLDF